MYGVCYGYDEAVQLLPLGQDVFCELTHEASTELHSTMNIHIFITVLKMG
jgi:hypothetical protein